VLLFRCVAFLECTLKSGAAHSFSLLLLLLPSFAGVFFTFIAVAVSERCNRLQLISDDSTAVGAAAQESHETSRQETGGGESALSSVNRSGVPLFRGLTLTELTTLCAPGASVEHLLERSRSRRLPGGPPWQNPPVVVVSSGGASEQLDDASKMTSPRDVCISPIADVNSARALVPDAE
jgi:hypothetical protein